MPLLAAAASSVTADTSTAFPEISPLARSSRACDDVQ
jgi:hypothetical protein